MDLTTDEQSEILCAHGWSTGHLYSFIQSIRFGADGWGTMVEGGGQIIQVEARFRHSFVRPGLLQLEFHDTPAWFNPNELGFERDEENAYRQVSFGLVRGPHQVECETMGDPVTVNFLWLLRFGVEPFPVGYQPGTTRLEYHGGVLKPGPAT